MCLKDYEMQKKSSDYIEPGDLINNDGSGRLFSTVQFNESGAVNWGAKNSRLDRDEILVVICAQNTGYFYMLSARHGLGWDIKSCYKQIMTGKIVT
jgi:hypothetical protein